MRLPEQYNIYKINEYLDMAHQITASLSDWNDSKYSVTEICIANLLNLKSLHAKIMHLELALDEVLKLPGVSDDNV